MNNFKVILREHVARYPLMQPCDAVKLLYQHVFGGGHMVTDEAACLRMLQMECKELVKRDDALLENLGNGLYRLNLAAVDEARLPLPCINRLFILSSQLVQGDNKKFFSLLDELSAAVAEGCFPFQQKELNQYLGAYRREGYPPVSHSDVYRNAYRPAYRVIDARLARLLPLIEEINMLMSLGEPFAIAIDGPAASGKTTAATLLGQIFDANVIHMDDFFLPFEMRTSHRLAEPGGNVHYERFSKEVLPFLPKSGPYRFRVFNCSIGSYSGERVLNQRLLTIVEGVYSQHPLLSNAYRLKVFFTILEEEQRCRILERNGADGLNMFIERWIPLENEYFSKCHIQQLCDITL